MTSLCRRADKSWNSCKRSELHVQPLERLLLSRQREFCIDNLLVRIHSIIVMIRWTGLAPWEIEFPVPGSLTSTFLVRGHVAKRHVKPPERLLLSRHQLFKAHRLLYHSTLGLRVTQKKKTPSNLRESFLVMCERLLLSRHPLLLKLTEFPLLL